MTYEVTLDTMYLFDGSPPRQVTMTLHIDAETPQEAHSITAALLKAEGFHLQYHNSGMAPYTLQEGIRVRHMDFP